MIARSTPIARRPASAHRYGRVLWLSLAGVWLLCASSAEPQTGAPDSAKPDGLWRWKFTMPDGTSIEPRLSLRTVDGQLTGVSRYRPGTETPITNASWTSNQLRFEVHRQREAATIVTRYHGTWESNRLRGTIETPWGGTLSSFPWEARRISTGIEGVWAWTNRLAGTPGRRPLLQLQLDRVDHQLTGRVLTRNRGPNAGLRFVSGSITNDQVSLVVEQTGERKSVFRYEGKLQEDVLEGRMSLEENGATRQTEWRALRSER